MKENKSKRRTYTLEFKKSAVALITEQGYKPAEAARSLGIGNNMIHKWRKDLESNGLAKLSNDEHEELDLVLVFWFLIVSIIYSLASSNETVYPLPL